MSLRDKAENQKLAAKARRSKLQAQRRSPKFTRKKRRRGAPTRLIGKAVVVDRCNISYPTVWRMMNAGTFPAAVEVGGKISWYEHEIEEWISNRPRTCQPEN